MPLFAYLDPRHEAALAARIREAILGVHVSASHEVLPQFREYERCSTTVIDAYCSAAISAGCGDGDRARAPGAARDAVLGGVVPADEAARAGAWSVLSGPAGGAVGAGLLARISGAGTRSGSTWAGPRATSASSTTVACGGPTPVRSRAACSSCRWSTFTPSGRAGGRSGGGTRRRLRVGPHRRRRARPASYGRGGSEPTVTDANLVLGYLAADSTLAGGVELIRIAPGGARKPRQSSASTSWRPRRGLQRREPGDDPRAAGGHGRARVDPREYALMPFGGAGPMHAAALARELEVERILCPRASGVLRRWG